MNTVKILVHKELATTFNSWSIYIGYTLFFCVCGFFSWLSSNNLLYIGQANMMQVFGIINWTQFFLIPALTMKSIADEKRNKICDAQMERMRGFLNQSEFDEELVHELIKKIYVGMDNSVEVEFKCSDPYQEVLAIMSEVQNE